MKTKRNLWDWHCRMLNRPWYFVLTGVLLAAAITALVFLIQTLAA
jgi:hypothetical protein